MVVNGSRSAHPMLPARKATGIRASQDTNELQNFSNRICSSLSAEPSAAGQLRLQLNFVDNP